MSSLAFIRENDICPKRVHVGNVIDAIAAFACTEAGELAPPPLGGAPCRMHFNLLCLSNSVGSVNRKCTCTR